MLRNPCKNCPNRKVDIRTAPKEGLREARETYDKCKTRIEYEKWAAGHFRRWRIYSCRMGRARYWRANNDIKRLEKMGYDAKIWATLPQHKESGHAHVVVLSTEADYLFKINNENCLRKKCLRGLVKTRKK